MRTEVSLGIVDASVYYIQPDFAPDPRLYFYGERRGGDRTSWSLGGNLGQSQHTSRKREQYKQHQFVLPEDTGQLGNWPADLIGMTQYGYIDGRDLNNLMYRGFEQARRPSPMTPMAAKGEAGRAGGYGGGGGGMRGGGRGGGAGGRGGMQKSTRADLQSEQMVQLPPVSLSGPLVGAQVRTRFADTAYWSPSVITDSDGTATVTVDMPENLTTWKATAARFRKRRRWARARARPSPART